MGSPPAMALQGVRAWDQHHDPAQIAYNLSQVHALRSTTLTIAGSVAGVLGLKNIAGFAFFWGSVVFINTVILFVNAQAQPDRYFVMYSPPLAANALETLAPSKVEQLRAPPSSSRRLLALMWWMAVQGAQENLLPFITWWTFWHGIVHVYD